MFMKFQIKQEEELEEDCNRLGNSRGPLLLRDFQESDVRAFIHITVYKP